MNINEKDEYYKIFPQEPSVIFSEVLKILSMIYPGFSGYQIDILKDAFWDTLRVFKGQYPGYKACNTRYHDIEHTLSVYLSSARLLDGVIIAGKEINPDVGVLGLIASLFHDIGLIQTINDNEGTGSKYMIGHEERSINFMKKYLAKKGYPEKYIKYSSQIITCTMMTIEVDKINFEIEDVELMGKIVGTVDLYTQLADRLYLEKLLYLYREFKEGGIDTFNSEFDLLQNTESFYKNVAFKRFDNELGGLYHFMKLHFKKRFGVDRDYYMEGITKNIEYLSNKVLKYRDEYRKMLRRAEIAVNLSSD